MIFIILLKWSCVYQLLCYFDFVKKTSFYSHVTAVNRKSKMNWRNVCSIPKVSFILLYAHYFPYSRVVAKTLLFKTLPHKPPLHGWGARSCLCGSVVNSTVTAKTHVFGKSWAHDWMDERWITMHELCEYLKNGCDTLADAAEFTYSSSLPSVSGFSIHKHAKKKIDFLPKFKVTVRGGWGGDSLIILEVHFYFKLIQT